ncbi:hypothetical protein HEK616_35010 [Streptomyces nigrescens]|uniref:Uncharacterized protein n=2 Tax=Streptomyces TaxID=1883 RepID=A0ABM7ZUH8_STRNI|nr:hypothetical protein [Streptomyces nigrescens]MEE4422405.1 hypothetical protein [Streptomyces sp. DSM 41528]BDM70014.1 hypothetical protein HEK616_35010 [Streptomyces nigrescens]
MSVNIDLELTVTGPSAPEQAERILKALEAVIRDEGMDHSVRLAVEEWEGQLQVVGGTDYPLIISGLGRWQPEFEKRVHQAVQEVAPSAKVDIGWGYPDDDDDY